MANSFSFFETKANQTIHLAVAKAEAKPFGANYEVQLKKLAQLKQRLSLPWTTAVDAITIEQEILLQRTTAIICTDINLMTLIREQLALLDYQICFSNHPLPRGKRAQEVVILKLQDLSFVAYYLDKKLTWQTTIIDYEATDLPLVDDDVLIDGNYYLPWNEQLYDSIINQCGITRKRPTKINFIRYLIAEALDINLNHKDGKLFSSQLLDHSEISFLINRVKQLLPANNKFLTESPKDQLISQFMLDFKKNRLVNNVTAAQKKLLQAAAVAHLNKLFVYFDLYNFHDQLPFLLRQKINAQKLVTNSLLKITVDNNEMLSRFAELNKLIAEIKYNIIDQLCTFEDFLHDKNNNLSAKQSLLVEYDVNLHNDLINQLDSLEKNSIFYNKLTDDWNRQNFFSRLKILYDPSMRASVLNLKTFLKPAIAHAKQYMQILDPLDNLDAKKDNCIMASHLLQRLSL